MSYLGYYSCSCHPFKTVEELRKFSTQKLNIGNKIQHRCSGKKGEVIAYDTTNTKGFVIVKLIGGHVSGELEHVENLIKIK